MVERTDAILKRIETIATNILRIKSALARKNISQMLGYHEELTDKAHLISHLKSAPDWVVDTIEEDVAEELGI